MNVINNSPALSILFVGNTAWSMYNFRRGLFSYLSDLGFKIIIAAPEDEYAVKLEQQGFQYVPLRKLNAKGYNPLNDYIFYNELLDIYRACQPRMIFHYTIKPNIYGTLAASKLGIASVAITTGLGYTFTHKGIVSSIARQLYRRSLPKADEIWFLNEEDRQIFIDNNIIPGHKSFLLPGEGIDTDHFSPGHEQQNPAEGNKYMRFILSARLISDKGIKEFAEASRILKAKGYKFESVLIGFMDVLNPKSISKAQISSWESEGIIKYLGVTENILPFLQESDCVVLPSFYREGIPRTLLEGASMAKVIITTDNVGCREVLDDGITGFLCKIKDPVDLALKMERVILMPSSERSEMGKKGREKMITMFDEKIIKNIYLAKIKELLSMRNDWSIEN